MLGCLSGDVGLKQIPHLIGLVQATTESSFPHLHLLAQPVCRNAWGGGIFSLHKFGRICRGFSWRIFMGTFSHKNEENIRRQNPRKKMSGPKIKKKNAKDPSLPKTDPKHFWEPRQRSGFLKRALAQACLPAWYQVRYFRCILGHSRALCKGKRVPLVWYLCTSWESLHMFFTEMCPSGGTKFFSFELLLGILRGLSGGRGGTPDTVPLPNPKITSRKACLRNAEQATKQFWSKQILRNHM